MSIIFVNKMHLGADLKMLVMSCLWESVIVRNVLFICVKVTNLSRLVY